MSKLSWALLAVGAFLFISGSVFLQTKIPLFQRQYVPMAGTESSEQSLHDMKVALRASLPGYILMGLSLIPFGFAAWRIYLETQTPKPGERPPPPPRQGGGRGF